MPIDDGLLNCIENTDPTLTELHLSMQFPPLNDSDIKRLIDAINKNNNTVLKRLLIDNNDITDDGAEYLKKLQHIEVLAIDGNNITDEGAKAIAQIPSLKTLKISNNLIGDEGFKSIINHSKLTSLMIDGNKITDSVAEYIFQNKILTNLIIDDNEMNNFYLDQIEKHIEGNKILSQETKNINKTLMNRNSHFYSPVEKMDTTPIFTPDIIDPDAITPNFMQQLAIKKLECISSDTEKNEFISESVNHLQKLIENLNITRITAAK